MLGAVWTVEKVAPGYARTEARRISPGRRYDGNLRPSLAYLGARGSEAARAVHSAALSRVRSPL